MITIHPAILVSLGFCFILLIYIIFEEHMGGIIKRGGLGCATIMVVNYFVPPYIALALNGWTIALACLFGIPGILGIYFIKVIRFLSF